MPSRRLCHIINHTTPHVRELCHTIEAATKPEKTELPGSNLDGISIALVFVVILLSVVSYFRETI